MKEPRISVLLVDDDREDMMIIRDLLDDLPDRPFALDWVASYPDAKRKIQEEKHDAYLIDYRLGAETGLDLISETGAHAKAPIILLTGQGDRNVDVEAMKRGANDYLVKSQLTALLIERSIRYAINRFQILHELKASEESLRRLYEERLQMEAQILQQDRLATIGLLASSLAHEIGTPLGVMRGRSELLMMHSDSDVVHKNAKVILDQIDRVSKLIRSLLTLARGDKSQSVVDVNVPEVLQEVLDLIGHELARHSIEIENAIDPKVMAKAEAGPLHQVFLNLLVNAMHAIQSVKTPRAHKVRLACERTDFGWNISITDTGCGIPKENLGKLFRPFFTTKDIGVGTGLGLATSYRIVENWDGRIFVDSEENSGTTFTIQLRAAER